MKKEETLSKEEFERLATRNVMPPWTRGEKSHCFACGINIGEDFIEKKAYRVGGVSLCGNCYRRLERQGEIFLGNGNYLLEDGELIHKKTGNERIIKRNEFIRQRDKEIRFDSVNKKLVPIWQRNEKLSREFNLSLSSIKQILR